MRTISIEVAENGFIVSEEQEPGCIRKYWAFETQETLANFIFSWGSGSDKGEISFKEAEK